MTEAQRLEGVAECLYDMFNDGRVNMTEALRMAHVINGWDQMVDVFTHKGWDIDTQRPL